MRDYTPADVEEAYNRGYDEGKCQAWSDEIKKYEIEPEKEREAYQRGLNDAWECARRLLFNVEDGGMSTSELCEIFHRNGFYRILKDYSAQEAIEKIDGYEKQKNALKVGDVVLQTYDNTMAVIMGEADEDHAWHVYTENGCVEKWSESVFRKTGRTFPQIEEVLKAMQEGTES